MKKKFFLVLVLITVLSGCTGEQLIDSIDSTSHSGTKNTTQKIEEISLSSSIKQDTTETNENSTETTNSEETNYPQITKKLLNGKSWYEGNSIGVENQPREGFKEEKFYDLFGNGLEYEMMIDDKEQTHKVLDFRENEIVDIKLKTKIKVNKPTIDGSYREVFYYLYYKYDGRLMIAREGTTTEESNLTSYPLEEINIWVNSNLANE